MSAIPVGATYLDVIPNASRFGSRLQTDINTRQRGRLRSIGAGIGTKLLAGFGAAFAAQKVARFVGDAVTAASDLSEATSAVEQVFGKASGAVVDFGGKAARNLGLANTEALEGARAFGAMLVPMDGISSRQGAKMSTRLVQLAGDMASFNNEDPTDMLDRLRAGLSGEAEPLRRFGVRLSAARIEQKALNLGLAESGGELSDAAKAQAAYAIILEDTKLQQGDFARTSGGLANQQRILSAQWQEMKARIGQALLPAITATVTFINDRMWPAFEAVSRVVRQASDAFTGGGKATRRYGGVVGRVVREVRRYLRDLARFVRAGLDAVQRFWDRHGDAITRFMRVALNVLARLFTQGLRILRGIIRAATGLISGDWSKFASGLRMVARALMQVLRTIIAASLRVIRSVWRTTTDTLSRVWGNTLDAISRYARDRLADVREWFRDRMARVRDIVSDRLADIRRFFRELPGKVLGFLRDLPGDLFDLGKRMIKRFGEGIKSALSGLGSGLASAAKTAINALNPFADGFGFLRQPATYGGASTSGLMPHLRTAANVVRRLGGSISSAFRPGSITSTGNLSYHARGRAIDIVPPSMTLFNALRTIFPNATELIFTPAGGRQLWHGRNHIFRGGTIQRDHLDHIHLALARGGRVLAPGRFLVGERGPEILNLRRNDMVAPLSHAAAALGGDTIINVDAARLPDALTIAREIAWRQRTAGV